MRSNSICWETILLIRAYIETFGKHIYFIFILYLWREWSCQFKNQTKIERVTISRWIEFERQYFEAKKFHERNYWIRSKNNIIFDRNLPFIIRLFPFFAVLQTLSVGNVLHLPLLCVEKRELSLFLAFSCYFFYFLHFPRTQGL